MFYLINIVDVIYAYSEFSASNTCWDRGQRTTGKAVERSKTTFHR